MTKKNGSVLVAAILLLAVRVYADPQFSVASPQGDVTLGKFESDADYFMSARNYTNMGFDKVFSLVSYKRQTTASIGNAKTYYANLAQLGFATRVGKLYMGMSYIGNALLDFGSINQGKNTYSYTEKKAVFPGGGEKTWKVFSENPVLNYAQNAINNEAALLFGIADMGFKVYFATNYQENSQSDFFSTNNATELYKNYDEQIGHINPGLVWGMAREIIPGRGLKPEVKLDLNFFRWNIKLEKYEADGTTRGMYVSRSENRFIPGFNLSTGDFTLARVNDLSMNIGLDYGIKLYLYDNEYSYPDANGKYQIKRLQGGRVGFLSLASSADFYDINQVYNSLTPKIGARWSGERLGLFAGLNLAMSIDDTTQTRKNLKQGSTDGSLVKDGEDKKTTKFSFNPEFNLAMQWAIVPERLFLNTGCKIRILEVSSETGDKKVYADGVEVETDRDKVISNVFNYSSTRLYLGVTFNITSNLDLQAALGVDNNSVNVFRSDIAIAQGDDRASGGLFSLANILLTLHY
jgi:hypothetical protein